MTFSFVTCNSNWSRCISCFACFCFLKESVFDNWIIRCLFLMCVCACMLRINMMSTLHTLILLRPLIWPPTPDWCSKSQNIVSRVTFLVGLNLFSNRSQQVKMDNYFSLPMSIKCSEPQGNVLCQILIPIYYQLYITGILQATTIVIQIWRKVVLLYQVNWPQYLVVDLPRIDCFLVSLWQLYIADNKCSISHLGQENGFFVLDLHIPSVLIYMISARKWAIFLDLIYILTI